MKSVAIIIAIKKGVYYTVGSQLLCGATLLCGSYYK